MNSHELNEQFGLPGILTFDDHGDLTRARVTLPSCEATVYLQGAHVTHWQPTGQEPVFFLSEKSAFTPGKAIRGGVPICFPWFGPRTLDDRTDGPSHGFARIQPWTLAFAALMPDTGAGDRLLLTFVLAPTDLSRSLGFDNFRVAYEVMLGSSLSLKLTVANLGTTNLKFEEALHAYYQVADVRQTALGGLESATYLDKRDAGKEKTAPAEPLVLTQFSDRVFPGITSNLVIDDAGNRRSIHIEKRNSGTTVVWNPWEEGSAALSDMAPGEWPHFLCVEAANTAADAITLAPDQAHTITNIVTVVTKAS